MMLPPHPTPPSAFCSCPLCRRRLPLRALFVFTNLRARWRCTHCAASLQLDQSLPKRLIGMAIAIINLLVFIYLIRLRPLDVVAFQIFFLLFLIFYDRATLDPLRNPTRCPACAYDLTGTQSAGLPRCPECGHHPLPHPPKHKPTNHQPKPTTNN